MYLKLNADYKQGELVPILDDAIYVYCDVCKSLQQIEDVSYAAFGVCSFEHLNACETCQTCIVFMNTCVPLKHIKFIKIP